MDPGDDVRQITDPAALKAVAHPLRVRLLAALREHGPATATELAQQLGTESGSTSYHLRVLARYGFIGEAEADPATRRHPRERRWQAVHRLNTWSNTALATTDAGREAAALMRRQQVEVLIGDVEHFEAITGDLTPAWVEVAGIGDLLVRLTPASLNTLWDTFYAHLEQLSAQDATTRRPPRCRWSSPAPPRPADVSPEPARRSHSCGRTTVPTSRSWLCRPKTSRPPIANSQRRFTARRTINALESRAAPSRRPDG